MDKLENLIIAAPCPISWESMTGDDTVRHCAGCSRDVYNISSMSSAEAEKFLAGVGASECMRFYRRADGRIMTDNCPRALRAIRNKCRLFLKFVSGLAASFIALVPIARGHSASAQELPGASTSTSTSSGTSTSTSSGTSTSKPTDRQSLPSDMMGEAILVPAAVDQSSAPSTNQKSGKFIMLPGDSCQSGSNPKTQAQSPPLQPSGADSFPVMGRRMPNRTQQLNSTAEKAQQSSLAEHRDFRDSKAYNLFMAAMDSEAHGNNLLAQSQYEAALKAAKAQSPADPKFAPLIESYLEKLKAKSAHQIPARK